MKKHTVLRFLSLALAALMLLSLSLTALIGCDSDEKETATETATETTTETATETATEPPLSAATPEDALSRVVTNLGTKTEEAAKNVAKDAAAGNFTFSFKTNLKVEAKVVVTTKIDMMGTTNTSETTATVAVTVAEGGVSVQVQVPQLADISVVCVDKAVYVSASLMGNRQTFRYTLDSKMQSELADLLNGKTEDKDDEQTKAVLESIRASLGKVGVADIFRSVTSKMEGGNLTISCKGLKTDFVEQLTQALEKAIQLVKDKTGTATEPADPEFDFDMPEGSGTLDSLLELFRSLKPDDFSVELDVNMDGQVLAVRAKATALQNQTEEGITMTAEISVAAEVTVTRGGQKVEKPTDADQYEEATMPFDEPAGGKLD